MRVPTATPASATDATATATATAATAAPRPGLGEQLSYAGGEMASNLSWNMVNGYLLYYYSDIVFLPIASLGTLMLLTRVFDAVADPIVGILVDRTRTRWGQARPYLLFAALPFGALAVLTFAVPDMSAAAKIAYAYVTFTLLGLLYSIIYIPYGALQPMMARHADDKVRIGGMRAMATSLASILVYGSITWITGLTGPTHKPAGYLLAAAIFAVITSGLYLLVFARCRERFTSTSRAVGRSIGRDLLHLLHNPVWLFVFAFGLISFVRLGSMVSVAAYFVNSVLQQPWMMAVLLPLLSVAILIGGFLASILFRRYGQRPTLITLLLATMALYAVMPRAAAHHALFVAVFMAANVVGGTIAAALFATSTDAVEYGEARYGSGNEGLVCSSVSFGMKVGMAIGAAFTAYALAWAGYDPHGVSARATHTIAWLFYYVPIVMLAVQLLAVLRYRPATAYAGRR